MLSGATVLACSPEEVRCSMKLHADLRQPAVVRGAAVAAMPSPMPGVERRMLERDGDEVSPLPCILMVFKRGLTPEKVLAGFDGLSQPRLGCDGLPPSPGIVRLIDRAERFSPERCCSQCLALCLTAAGIHAMPRKLSTDCCIEIAYVHAGQ